MWQRGRIHAMCTHMASKSARALASSCEELGPALAGAHDLCAVAWDDSPEPRIACVAGPAQPVLGSADLVGKPAGLLFPGGERAARDLAQAAARGSFEEHRTLLRAGQPFPAQLLLSPAPGGVVALVRDMAVSQQVGDAALRAQERHGTLGSNDLRRTSIALREVLNIELLLNEVLEFARPPSLSLVPGDPRAPVEQAVAGVEQEWASRGVTFPRRGRTAVKILCRQAAVAAEEAGGGVVEVSLREVARGWELSVADPGRTLS